MNVYPHATRFSQVVKSIAPAGVYTQDLGGFQLGMYNTADKSRKSITDASTAKSIFLVVGSPNQGVNQQSVRGFADPTNTQESFKSREANRIVDLYTMGPQYGKPFIGYLGYNNVNAATESLSFKCGETYSFEVRVQGKVVENVYGQHEIFERFTVDAPCCDETCGGTGCNDETDSKNMTDKVVALMNNSRNKVSRFGEFYAVNSCTSTPAITTYAATQWSIDVTDMGNVASLAAIKSQYPTFNVSRTARTGMVSTYSFCKDGVVAPANYDVTGTTVVSSCDACAAGYTFVPGTNVFSIVKQLSLTEDFGSDDKKQALAYQAATVYMPIASTAIDMTATVLTAGFLAANTFTVTGHKFATGQKVMYSNGGGTTPTSTGSALVSGTAAYVIKIDANTIKLATTAANAFAGTAIDITAAGLGTAHSLTPYYGAQTAVNSATASNTTTDAWTITGHGFKHGEAVVYNNGGGTTPTSTSTLLVSGTTYYIVRVDANNFKLATTLANAIAGTVIDLTSTGAGAAHSFNSINPPVAFVSQNGATYTSNMTLFADAVAPVATGTDLVFTTAQKVGTCVAGSSTIPWVNTGSRYKVRRKLCVTVKNDDCDNTNVDTLNEIKAMYSVIPSVEASTIKVETVGNCLSMISLEQYNNNCMQDGCDTLATATYDDLVSYKGLNWSECPVTVAANVGCKSGIKVVGRSFADIAQSCGYDPTEYKEYDSPIFEIYLVAAPAGCMVTPPSWYTAQMPTFDTLDGHRVLHEILLYRQYRGEKYFSPSMELGHKFSEAEGLVYGIDPNKRYFVVHALIDYGETTSLTASYGDKLEEIQFFFEDITLRDTFLTMISTYASRMINDVKVEYRS